MPRTPLKEWTPPKDKEVYTETLRPNEKIQTRDYLQFAGDQFVLAMELPIGVLSPEQTWKEAMRAARALVKNYLIKSVMVRYFPRTEGQLYDRVRIYQKYNPDAISLLKLRTKGNLQ
jgi:hypothetical protein